MTLSYSIVEPLLNETRNNFSEIATVFNNDWVTVQPIPIDELLYWMNQVGMLTRRLRPSASGERWEGTVVNMLIEVNDNPLAVQYRNAVNQWFSHITNDRNLMFDTTQKAFAQLLKLIEIAFGNGGIEGSFPTPDQFQHIVSLGGGYRYTHDYTPAQIQKIVEDYDEEQNRQSMISMYWERHNYYVATILDGNQPFTVKELQSSLLDMSLALDMTDEEFERARNSGKEDTE